jgi:uncharacterized membrane protein YphA (DoxX/SURF4 family)
LAIGWHFFFEGWQKLRTHWDVAFGDRWYQVRVYEIKPPETVRPFSSEIYFREATGPLGPFVRSQIGDLDDQALAHLTVEPIPEGKDPNSVPANERVPPALGKDIDDYVERYFNAFALDDVEKEVARAKAKQAKGQLVLWLTYTMPEKEADREKTRGTMWRMVKATSPDGKANEVPKTAAQRIVEYRAKLAEVADLRDHKLPSLGRDVEKARLTKAKADAVQVRRELLDDLDQEVGKHLREGLNDILKEKLARLGLPTPPTGEDAVKFLLPPSDGKSLPEPYDATFDEYYKLVVDTFKLGPEQMTAAETKLTAAKKRTAEWLAKKETKELPARYAGYDQAAMLTLLAESLSSVPGAPLFAVSAAAPYRQWVQNDARAQMSAMKAAVNSALTDDQSKGVPPPEERRWTFLRVIDQLTMWGLTIIGACLLLGLFTRTNCVLAAGFLVLTYLAAPAFPWVPTPPNNEGNYLYVNKNLVELLALLVLATTESGKWLGLDAMLAWFFGRKKPRPRARPLAKAAA